MPDTGRSAADHRRYPAVADTEIELAECFLFTESLGGKGAAWFNSTIQKVLVGKTIDYGFPAVSALLY
jgi:hypothetical protein